MPRLGAMTVYATPEDYKNFMHEPIPGAGIPDAERRELLRVLDSASGEVAAAIAFTRYDIDRATGFPARADQAAAVKRATCQWARWFRETGDETGAADKWDSISTSSSQLDISESTTKARRASAQSSATAATSRIAPQAIGTLRTAGLLNPGWSRR